MLVKKISGQNNITIITIKYFGQQGFCCGSFDENFGHKISLVLKLVL